MMKSHPIRKGASLALALLVAATLPLHAQFSPAPALPDAPGAPAAPAAPAAPDEIAPAAAANTVVLTVDGTPIAENDVREILIARFGRQLEQMPPEQAGMIQQQMQQMVVTDLVNKIVLLNAANAEGYEATDEAVEEQLVQIASRLPEGVELEAYAAEAGIDLNRIRAQIRDDVKIRQLIEMVTAEVEKPGKEEVKTYYDEHPEEFSEEATVEASHILLSTREVEDEAGRLAKKAEAEKLKLQLEEGEGDKAESFAALAEAHSDCPSKEDGGNLGGFSRGQMVPAFEEAAFTQEVGAVGDLVETQFGYHLILVTDRREAKTHTFEEIEETLTENLHEAKKGEKVESYISELVAKADIQQPGMPAAPAVPSAPADDDAPTAF